MGKDSSLDSACERSVQIDVAIAITAQLPVKKLMKCLGKKSPSNCNIGEFNRKRFERLEII